MKRTRVLSGALAVTAASLALATPALAATPATGLAAVAKLGSRVRLASSAIGAFVPTKASETVPSHGGTATSLNWSGYAVTPTGGDITAINSSFVVPTANALFPGFAATWAGIGGYSTSDLIQAGVTENSEVGGLIGGGTYYAWYELLPAAETEITSGCSGDSTCAVSPGDDITVHITNAGGNTWSISIADAGKWTWSKNVTYTSSESSAEWILEAPTVDVQTPLADVGTTSFGPTSTYVAGGQTYTIAEGDPTQLFLSPSPVALPDGLGDEATPSALAADGQSFNSCAYALSCATP